MVKGLKDPVADLLRSFRKKGSVETISDRDFYEAERQINDKMRKFSMEMRSYFAQSIESARHAYITF